MKRLSTSLLMVFIVFSLSSCYTYQFNVGSGPQKGTVLKGKNHYFLWGLAEGKTTDFKELAGDTKDYQVTIQHTFVDGLLYWITLGIYTPTSVIVQK